MILKKIMLSNFFTKEIVYNKIIRGGFTFMAEPHLLEGGKTLQLFLYRNHPKIKPFIEKAQTLKKLGEQNTNIDVRSCGVMRITFNDEKEIMINTTSAVKIKIKELNFNPKDFVLKDFENGKVAIMIEMTFEKEVDNTKFKQEIKDYFKEE